MKSSLLIVSYFLLFICRIDCNGHAKDQNPDNNGEHEKQLAPDKPKDHIDHDKTPTKDDKILDKMPDTEKPEPVRVDHGPLAEERKHVPKLNNDQNPDNQGVKEMPSGDKKGHDDKGKQEHGVEKDKQEDIEKPLHEQDEEYDNDKEAEGHEEESQEPYDENHVNPGNEEKGYDEDSNDDEDSIKKIEKEDALDENGLCTKSGFYDDDCNKCYCACKGAHVLCTLKPCTDSYPPKCTKSEVCISKYNPVCGLKVEFKTFSNLCGLNGGGCRKGYREFSKGECQAKEEDINKIVTLVKQML